MAIEECRDSKGNVDVEDTMVVSRSGIGKLREVKSKSNSNDYKSYRKFLDKDGRKFVDAWLAYYHQDI